MSVQVERGGRILRVDLTSRALTADTLDEATWRLYVGGSLLGTRILLSETRPGLGALDPDAPLVFAASAVAGYPAAGLPRFAVVGKSPMTGGIGEARAEGPFGVALKASGFDAIVVRGQSERPVALTIVDGRPALVPAGGLWGLDTSQVVDVLTAQIGRCSVAAIGPAGERMVRYASIISDRSFALPRMGLGAVMGSKQLKAIAIAGRGAAAPVADPTALETISARYRKAVPSNPVTRWQHQPPGFGTWVGHAAAGSFSVRNFGTSQVPLAGGYADAAFMARLAWSTDGCPGCPSDCIKGFASSTESAALARFRQLREGGLHQEAIAALGPNLGLAGVDEALALNAACLRFGLDPVSLGFTLSFAMECRELGFLASSDLEGVDLRFGAAPAAVDMTDRIARREGAGDWLAEGSRRAADRLGGEAAAYALQVKGLELAPFDPRAQAGLALGFATAPFGPRYDVAEHDADFDDVAPAWPHALELSNALGIERRMPARAQTPEKVRSYAILSQFWSALDAMLVCPFASAPVRILSLADVAAIGRAVTGWDVDDEEVLAWGARRMQLMRIYNLREGLTAADDRLPDRFFDEPIDAGPLAGSRLDRAAFGTMIAGYYDLMGWDTNGVPTPATRMRHDLGWAIPAGGS